MTAPVELFTGKPGAGKTAQLVAVMMKLREEEPGRPLFALGINGLDPDIAIPLELEQLHKWWELPPGSIICIDECQEDHLMPRDRGAPAEWVQRITKVRHYGMSFLLTTQHPSNMSAYVRRLVGRHVHTVNKFQTGVIQRFEWQGCADDPESKAGRKQATESVGTLPKEVFDKYKSSQLHTTKARIPKKVYLFGVMVLVAIAGIIAVPIMVKRAQNKNVEMITGQGAAGAHASSDSLQAKDDSLRQKDYVAWMKPRVDGLPWTAPMFDGQTVAASPRLYCIAVEDGGCSCITEQGTKYVVPVATCRAVALHGVYNPFIAPRRDDGGQDRHARDQAQPRGHDDLPAVGIPGPIADRATSRPYVPPAYGAWNPEGASTGK